MARQNKEMKVRNENRPGYKKTRVGWIPEEWTISKFRDIVKINPPKVTPCSKTSIVKFISMADISNSANIMKIHESVYYEVSKGYSSFVENDILIAKITPCFENGKGALVENLDGLLGYGSTEFHVLRPTNRSYGKFLYFHSISHTFRQKGSLNMIGSAGHKRVPNDYIENYSIPLPSLSEQQKISNILSTWDKAITQIQTLIDSKTKLKKGLMQKLFSASASADKSKWKKIRLSQVTRQSSERNTNCLSKDCIMAVTKQSGLIPMKKEKIGNNINRYKIVRQNWFAYNPMRVNIGSIARWEKSDVVMVSPDYVVFSADETQLCPEYLDHFRHSHEWKSYLYAAGSGSVRTRIYYKDLARMKFRLPPIHEQKKIIHILNLCETEITQLTKQKNALEKQKKGLMQKLLTGEIRV